MSKEQRDRIKLGIREQLAQAIAWEEVAGREATELKAQLKAIEIIDKSIDDQGKKVYVDFMVELKK